MFTDSKFSFFEQRDFKIIEQNNDFVIIDKPIGYASHSSKGFSGPNVWGKLVDEKIIDISNFEDEIQDNNYPGIVSRLDVATSGIMLIALNQTSYDNFKSKFQNRQMKKTYTLLCSGYPKVERGSIQAPISRKGGGDFRFEVNMEGKEAITNYQVLEKFQRYSLIEVYPKTGRTHQIRVHFNSIGHSILGDTIYGLNPKLDEELDINRLMLNSTKLAFNYNGVELEYATR